MHCIFVNCRRKISANSARLCISRIGCTHYFTILGNGAFSFQNLHDYGAGGHEFNQVIIEWALGYIDAEADEPEAPAD